MPQIFARYLQELDDLEGEEERGAVLVILVRNRMQGVRRAERETILGEPNVAEMVHARTVETLFQELDREAHVAGDYFSFIRICRSQVSLSLFLASYSFSMLSILSSSSSFLLSSSSFLFPFPFFPLPSLPLLLLLGMLKQYFSIK